MKEDKVYQIECLTTTKSGWLSIEVMGKDKMDAINTLLNYAACEEITIKKLVSVKKA